MDNILNNEDYELCLLKIDSLMGCMPGSDDEKELEKLCILAEKYEFDNFKI
jgi:hypothetical protein